MVNGYVATDTAKDMQCRCKDLINLDPSDVLFPEWARFAAWRSASKLHHLIDSLEFATEVGDVAAQLEDAIGDTRRAIDEMRTPPPMFDETFEAPDPQNIARKGKSARSE